MIVEPEQRVPDFIKAGADIVSVHCEQSSTIHLHRTVDQVTFLLPVYSFLSTLFSINQHSDGGCMQIKSLGAKAGVVLNPGTPLSAIEYVLDSE